MEPELVDGLIQLFDGGSTFAVMAIWITLLERERRLLMTEVLKCVGVVNTREHDEKPHGN